MVRALSWRNTAGFGGLHGFAVATARFDVGVGALARTRRTIEGAA
jgi:hypothetical protein